MLGTGVPSREILRAPQFPGVRWSQRTAMLAPSPRERIAEPSAGRFTFLNHTQTIGWPPAWSQPDQPKLWQYNLHYFEYLWQLDYQGARHIVEDWITRHTPSSTAVGWEPYPTSLRLQNWCAVFFDKFREQTLADEVFRTWLWKSMFHQAQWLAGHLEFHLLGNHLLENAVTLAMLGSCFNGVEAQAWHDLGVDLLARELVEQILPDGGHFERSPMYHDRVMYTLATLFNIGSEDVRSIVYAPLAKMVEASHAFAHGDGKEALFNDAASGIYPTGTELAKYAKHAGAITELPAAKAGFVALPDTGYFGWRGADGTSVLCDAAPIGPDYLPGHAHGDIFSFELCLRGQRVLVDSGTYDYEPGEMRTYCRSTAAHNTVEIDNQDQCEFWGAFRVARRGHPHDLRHESLADGFRLSGWHDGYMRLAGKPTHARRFRWHAVGVLMVRDVVNSLSSHQIVSRLHLHPGCTLQRVAEHAVQVISDQVHCTILTAGGLLGVEDGWFCPEFGVRQSTQVLTLSTFGSHATFGFCVINDASAESKFDLHEGTVVHGHQYGW